MNRRNFVVGLGTVATISGVASVTAAQFASGVTPTAEFRVRPQDRDLTIEGSNSYSPGTDPQWTNVNLSNTSGNSDFKNATELSSADAVAYQDNSSVDDGLVTKLAFNNSNTSNNYTVFDHTDGGDEFFQVVNNGETDEEIVFQFEYGADVDGTDITESLVADTFIFEIGGTRVSPSGSDPGGTGIPATVNSGQTADVALIINVREELYTAVQSQAGGAFSQTANSLELLQAVNVDTA